MERTIRDVRITPVHMPRVDPRWRTATHASDAAVGFVLEAVTDGVTGLGGTASHPRNAPAEALEKELRGVVRKELIGADPFAGNAVRRRLAQARVHPRALLAADLALQDLTGRYAGCACHALWGGLLRPQVTIVRMVGLKNPGELETAVAGLMKEGIRHFKVKIGTGITEDVERVNVLRRAFGEKIWIALDGNGAYSTEEAIRLCRAMEPYDVACIEQPIDYRDLEGLARLTESSPVPIMADQCVTDVRSALTLCLRKAAHIVSIKATKMGSLEECRRVYEVCRAFGIRVHIGGTAGPAVVDVAQAHLAASLPEVDEECEVGEFLALQGDPFRGVSISEGRIVVSHDPGWGLTLALPLHP